MEELPQKQEEFKNNDDLFLCLRRSSRSESDTFPGSKGNLQESVSKFTDDEDIPKKRILKRVKHLFDSDSDNDKERTQNAEESVSDDSGSHLTHKSILKIENDDNKFNSITPKSMPLKSCNPTNGNISGSGDSESDNAIKYREQQLRMKNKRKKLKDKFKSLVTNRENESSTRNMENGMKNRNDSESESGEEMASINKIKQKIKERMSFKPSICDPDTSDEENRYQKPAYKQKKERKMTKPTSPKPQRISAKQAMENMQKIKSESNRMLREKEVSLPYHRPKALSLKDIMSRRKIAVDSDGKALPIKMNEQQLRQYIQMLNERQKEMIELCKSESEEEETNENTTEAKEDSAINEIKVNNALEIVCIEKLNSDNTTIGSTNNNINNNELGQNKSIESEKEDSLIINDSDKLVKEQDSETSMQLVYNDSANSSIDDKLRDTEVITKSESDTEHNNINIDAVPKNTETETTIIEVTNEGETKQTHTDTVKSNIESQLISLHFETEKTDNSIDEETVSENISKTIEKAIETFRNSSEDNITNQDEEKRDRNEGMEIEDVFSDDDLNIADIDNIIENAEFIKDLEDKLNSQFLVRDKPLNLNPKLTGAPGMVINLDDSDTAPTKSGVELLKERFIYFSKLKTPEEMEREREKKLKPGTQLKKLKQELEEEIAEQRSLEWAKRLENEKQLRNETKELRGEESDDNDIDEIEPAIEKKEKVEEESGKSESEEDEPVEDDIVITDKPRVKSLMVDDEAEESDCDENEANDEDEQNVRNDGINDDDEEKENESESDESDESSESEDEEPLTTKKGRILKAFEDSDEEDAAKSNDQPVVEIKEATETCESKSGSSIVIEKSLGSQIVSQDEELQLAQRPKSTSDDLFTSQESNLLTTDAKEQSKDVVDSDEVFTQTFSILDSSKQPTSEIVLNSSDKLTVVCATQSLDIGNLDDGVSLCPVIDSQNNLSLPSQIPTTQLSQSLPIGEDIVALCTGQFYNNQFLSQVGESNIQLDDSKNYDAFDNYVSQDSQEEEDNLEGLVSISMDKEKGHSLESNKIENFMEINDIEQNKECEQHKIVDDNLNSILDELADPEFDLPKPNKFFVGNKNTHNDLQNQTQLKKRFVIDSDDEIEKDTNESKIRKKIKKKTHEKRALQISDDEEELSEQDEIEEYESDIEEDNSELLVEYDSEENEIEVKPQNPKKKRKTTEFFENEAELTSEDEWVGSGDEDEAGLDRMEREEGDDDTFHQGKLQRELGQIHMREVLDQDKREVRLIQELLFEDGDLGGGSRQRKFRWNNIDGDEESGAVADDLADTQEEEFESEEQWRKQRHERETFLRQMQNKDGPDESLNISVNRTTIIKANLQSKTMSSLLMEVNESTTEKIVIPAVEKKTVKDIPSPKKPFALLQRSYQGSLLSRGRGALARLAALATPLAGDDDARVGTLGPSSRRNFVFTALNPEEKAPKVTKRKAESISSTPKLIKKMRTDEKQNTTKSSLLDHFEL